MNEAFPSDIQRLIYAFDPTFHSVYKECMAHVRLCAARKIRLVKEVERLRREPDVHVAGDWRPYRGPLRVVFHHREYTLSVPFNYPFEPPRIECAGKKFRPFDHWSPAACLFTALLTCDVEGNAGTESC